MGRLVFPPIKMEINTGSPGRKKEKQHRPDAIGGTSQSTAILQPDIIWPNVSAKPGGQEVCTIHFNLFRKRT
jgi:hypothetical protein